MAGTDDVLAYRTRRAVRFEMTTGALLFAFANEHIDYVRMAAWSAKNIHRHLDIPVCVVTDSQSIPSVFDKVIRVGRHPTECHRTFADIDAKVTWYNHDRVDAYDLSPWDQTLLLDADYVIAGDSLLTLLASNRDILCYRWAFDMQDRDPATNNLNYFGTYRMPMSWATVVVFRRSRTADFIFKSMRMVRDNWRHYCDIYGVARGPYRNDYALSIARGIVAGHVPDADTVLPAMINVLPDQRLVQQSRDQYQVTWKDPQGRDRYVQLRGVDFHAMCKGQLGEIVANHS